VRRVVILRPRISAVRRLFERNQMAPTTTRRQMSSVRGTAIAGLLLLAAGCQSTGPVAPAPSTRSESPTPTPAPTPPPTPVFPPLSGPSRTFVFDRGLTYQNVENYTRTSRFVLYDDGAFALQYGTPALEYRGGYTEANGVITFEWEGWNVGGPWGASGTVTANTLTVQFNLIMQLTDFEDAVYVLKP
jgi:hypothetical protein